MLRNQHVRAFNEIKDNITNAGEIITGAKIEARTTDRSEEIYVSIREALLLQLFLANLNGNENEVNAIKELLNTYHMHLTISNF